MTVTKKKPKKKALTTKQKQVLEEMQDVEQDPRKLSFISNYFDPLSTTYGNALQSAIKAGFTPEYSKNLLANKPKWLWEIVGKMDMFDSVRRNIKKHLDIKTEVPVMTAFGPYKDKKTGKVMMREDPKMLKIQQDMTMFVAEKLVDGFKKKEKDDHDGARVEIKQIIIMSPNGAQTPMNQISIEKK